MQLRVDNQNRIFRPIQTFRAEWDLPDNFNLSSFEPKDLAGLGSLEGAGPALTRVRARSLQAIKPKISGVELFETVDQVSRVFHQALLEANEEIGLRTVEIDFAVAGFYDVLQTVAYHLVTLTRSHQNYLAQPCSKFDFSAVYQMWLNDSVRVATTTHRYQHANTTFEVRVIYNAFGRIGLEVQVKGELHYVTDMSLACPAASYMYALCNDVAQALCQALAL